jgi:hypothetical protein
MHVLILTAAGVIAAVVWAAFEHHVVVEVPAAAQVEYTGCDAFVAGPACVANAEGVL